MGADGGGLDDDEDPGGGGGGALKTVSRTRWVAAVAPVPSALSSTSSFQVTRTSSAVLFEGS